QKVMSLSSCCLCLAAAICLCGCLLCADSAPAPTTFTTSEPYTEEDAVSFLHKEFYSNAGTTKDGRVISDIIREELRRINLKYEGLSNMTVSTWRKFLRDAYMGVYLKQQSNGDVLLNVREKEDLLTRIPDAILSRVYKWNARPMTRKFEESIFIGTPKMVQDLAGREHHGWSFILDRSISEQRITKLSMSVHLTPKSRSLVKAMRISVYMLSNASDTLLSPRATKNVILSAAAMDEISVDFSTDVKPIITKFFSPQSGDQIELFFLIECPQCKTESDLNVAYLVMDCKVRIRETTGPEDQQNDRQKREASREPWPFEVAAASLFNNVTSSKDITKTQKCILEKMRMRHGQVSCCMMDFTYDLIHQSAVLAPRQLQINYCTGECHGQSEVNNAHSSLLQIFSHSQTSQLSHATREEISLCCVANTYRDFQVLTVVRKPGGGSNVQLKTIKDLSAETCTCA
uniref:TGF_BETA_2 domain-containing protein n=1 Tax=Macrostomum lignano TaxID=282301 RepID=A0A1I8HCH0_9PLAT